MKFPACFLRVCLLVLGFAAQFTFAAATSRGSYEIETGTVEEVFEVEDDGHRFVAYRITWKNHPVIVSDALAKSRHQRGDEIRFMVHRGRSSRADGFASLGFTLVTAPAKLDTPEGQRMMRLINGDLDVAQNERERFYGLNRAAKNALKEGDTETAAKLAGELEQLAPKYPTDWNYGNAVHHANQVFGHVALNGGKIDEAKRRLLASADIKGSPQLNSFGPDMGLAKALLDKGERETVLEYFQRCRAFWKSGGERLDRWTKEVEAGRIPDFGGNLNR